MVRNELRDFKTACSSVRHDASQNRPFLKNYGNETYKAQLNTAPNHDLIFHRFINKKITYQWSVAVVISQINISSCLNE